eukprot:4031314-Pleurochrysis_carterae.AAC.2
MLCRDKRFKATSKHEASKARQQGAGISYGPITWYKHDVRIRQVQACSVESVGTAGLILRG